MIERLLCSPLEEAICDSSEDESHEEQLGAGMMVEIKSTLSLKPQAGEMLDVHLVKEEGEKLRMEPETNESNVYLMAYFCEECEWNLMAFIFP